MKMRASVHKFDSLMNNFVVGIVALIVSSSCCASVFLIKGDARFIDDGMGNDVIMLAQDNSKVSPKLALPGKPLPFESRGLHVAASIDSTEASFDGYDGMKVADLASADHGEHAIALTRALFVPFNDDWEDGVEPRLKPCPPGFSEVPLSKSCCQRGGQSILQKIKGIFTCLKSIALTSRGYECNPNSDYTYLYDGKCYKVIAPDIPTCGTVCPDVLKYVMPNGCSVPGPVMKATIAYSKNSMDIVDALTPSCNRHDMCIRCVDKLNPGPKSYTPDGDPANFLRCQNDLTSGWLYACLQFAPGDWRRERCFTIARAWKASSDAGEVLGKSIDPFYEAYKIEVNTPNVVCLPSFRKFLDNPYIVPEGMRLFYSG